MEIRQYNKEGSFMNKKLLIVIFIFVFFTGFKSFNEQIEFSNSQKLSIGQFFYYRGNPWPVTPIGASSDCFIGYGNMLQIINFSPDGQSALVEMKAHMAFKWSRCTTDSVFSVPIEFIEHDNFDSNITFEKDQILYYKRAGNVWVSIDNKTTGDNEKKCIIKYGDSFKIKGIGVSEARVMGDNEAILVEPQLEDRGTNIYSCTNKDWIYLLIADLTPKPINP